MGAVSLIIKSALAAAAADVYILAVTYTSGAARVISFIAAAVFVLALCIHPCGTKEGGRLGMLRRGYFGLGIFVIALTAAIAVNIFLGVTGAGWKTVLINSIIGFFCVALIFTASIVRVYTSSVQLGIKWRALGLFLAYIPPLNIIMLGKIIKLCREEYIFECDRAELDRSRKDKQICATKYPLLMVHGVFFRDVKLLNYWGRIPKALEANGAKIFYGSQQSADSVAGCAAELKARIDEIVEQEGCEKVNIIAHSKGGLDSRYAVALLGANEKVASLTTINTPHRGCQFADYLLSKAPEGFKNTVANGYNATLRKLGDKEPDFISAVTDLTASACEELNKICEDAPNVYYQSVGSRSVSAMGGKFPMNLSYHLVKYFDGPNDGLVSVESMKWGESFRFLEPAGKRGITHADVIDLNRENIKGFDVREFYVGLVSDLREKGF